MPKRGDKHLTFVQRSQKRLRKAIKKGRFPFSTHVPVYSDEFTMHSMQGVDFTEDSSKPFTMDITFDGDLTKDAGKVLDPPLVEIPFTVQKPKLEEPGKIEFETTPKLEVTFKVIKRPKPLLSSWPVDAASRKHMQQWLALVKPMSKRQRLKRKKLMFRVQLNYLHPQDEHVA